VCVCVRVFDVFSLQTKEGMPWGAVIVWAGVGWIGWRCCVRPVRKVVRARKGVRRRLSYPSDDDDIPDAFKIA
jgi:hypothetical protein